MRKSHEGAPQAPSRAFSALNVRGYPTRVHYRSTPPVRAPWASRHKHRAWVDRLHGWGQELPMRGHIAGRHDNGSKATINSNNPNTPPRGSTLLSFYAGKRKRKNKSGAARLTPACREDSSCLRGSGRLPLALHRGAMAGRHATTSQAGTTAWRLTAATARRVAA